MSELFKIKIDQHDPESIRLEELYEDKLPAEAKQLEDFVNQDRQDQRLFRNYGDGNVVMQPHLVKYKDWIDNRMLPEDGRDHKKIAQLRVQDFEQQADKDRARQARGEMHYGHMQSLKAFKGKQATK